MYKDNGVAMLSPEQRQKIRALITRRLSARLEPCALTRPDIQAAIDALDSWLDANVATINAAIPQPARSTLTAAQKAEILAYVALTRYTPF